MQYLQSPLKEFNHSYIETVNERPQRLPVIGQMESSEFHKGERINAKISPKYPSTNAIVNCNLKWKRHIELVNQKGTTRNQCVESTLRTRWRAHSAYLPHTFPFGLWLALSTSLSLRNLRNPPPYSTAIRSS